MREWLEFLFLCRRNSIHARLHNFGAEHPLAALLWIAVLLLATVLYIVLGWEAVT